MRSGLNRRTEQADELRVQKNTIDLLKREIKHERLLTGQRCFLLEQAPMLDMVWDRSRLVSQIVRYGYVHPATWGEFRGKNADRGVQLSADNSYYTLPPSPTKWVLTNLMPGFSVPEDER
jgi:hypothetical protein